MDEIGQQQYADRLRKDEEIGWLLLNEDPHLWQDYKPGKIIFSPPLEIRSDQPDLLAQLTGETWERFYN